MKPIVHDLYCGLGGWSEGFLSEGYECIGYDIEKHDYGTGTYPGTLILCDVRSIHGSQLKDAAVIVASPPCQEPSYRAMPWKRAKALNAIGPPHNFIELFNACFRIQREASEAAGRYIPLIVENVIGAQRWVGKASWHFGSFYLWGDVPALMPMNFKPRKSEHVPLVKTPPGTGATSWFFGNSKHEGRFYGVKNFTPNGEPLGKNTLGRKHGSKSKARKAASAQIAKIPFPLAQHIARVFKPAKAATA